MANRDIVLSIIVLLGIGWLLFANYNKSTKPEAKPATIQHVKPIEK